MGYSNTSNGPYILRIRQKMLHNAVILYASIVAIEALPILRLLEMLSLTQQWS